MEPRSTADNGAEVSLAKPGRVREIDLLRFLAAMAVVFFHYTFRGYAADSMSPVAYPLLAPISKYGYLGVELFFMISGFVILMTAARGSFKGFFASRFARLYPAFWTCCTITFVLTLLIGGTHFTASVKQYLVNMTMLNGFVGVPSIDGVYWSLFEEIKFYALVAVVLLVGKIDKAQWFLMGWLVVSVAFVFLPVGKLLRFVAITDHAAFFIAGAMCFLVWSSGVTAARAVTLVAAWALAVWQSIAILPQIETYYSTSWSGLVVAGIVSVFFLAMVLVSVRRTGFVGRTNWLVAGALTYPLYLLHQNIGFMLFNLGYPTVNPTVLLLSTLATVLVTAYGVNVIIEKRFGPPLKVAVAGSLSSVEERARRLRRPRAAGPSDADD